MAFFLFFRTGIELYDKRQCCPAPFRASLFTIWWKCSALRRHQRRLLVQNLDPNRNFQIKPQLEKLRDVRNSKVIDRRWNLRYVSRGVEKVVLKSYEVAFSFSPKGSSGYPERSFESTSRIVFAQSLKISHSKFEKISISNFSPKVFLQERKKQFWQHQPKIFSAKSKKVKKKVMLFFNNAPTDTQNTVEKISWKHRLKSEKTQTFKLFKKLSSCKCQSGHFVKNILSETSAKHPIFFRSNTMNILIPRCSKWNHSKSGPWGAYVDYFSTFNIEPFLSHGRRKVSQRYWAS